MAEAPHEPQPVRFREMAAAPPRIAAIRAARAGMTLQA
jgi:hypothetical protein